MHAIMGELVLAGVAALAHAVQLDGDITPVSRLEGRVRIFADIGVALHTGVTLRAMDRAGVLQRVDIQIQG